MREDKDFKPNECSDGNIIYTNLEKVCEGLPEWGDIYCYICRQKIKHDPDDSNINFYSFDNKRELWYKFFHSECKHPKGQNQKVMECDCLS